MSGFPEKGADLRGSPGNFRGSLGNFRGTSGLLLSATVRELPGKSPKNFWGSSGNFRGSPGTSQGSLTPSQRLAQFVPNIELSPFRDGETTIRIEFAVLKGGKLGAERKIVPNAVFRGKRHDNKILKVQISLSRNIVVIVQAPKLTGALAWKPPRTPPPPELRKIKVAQK